MITTIENISVVPTAYIAISDQTLKRPLPEGWKETPDFDTKDPWSILSRAAIEILWTEGAFGGSYFEGGFGDGRLSVAAGIFVKSALNNIETITGVDLDGWRLDLARQNLEQGEIPAGKYHLIENDVIAFIQALPFPNTVLTDYGVACLPQVPIGETQNHADGIKPTSAILPYVNKQILDTTANALGYSLNYALLAELRQKVEPDFNLLLTLSGRIPLQYRNEMYQRTGWTVVRRFRTEEPILQDIDTGITHTIPFDDGRRFYEKGSNGIFSPISAQEAERRRAMEEKRLRIPNLKKKYAQHNVFHHVSVDVLQPVLSARRNAR